MGAFCAALLIAAVAAAGFGVRNGRHNVTRVLASSAHVEVSLPAPASPPVYGGGSSRPWTGPAAVSADCPQMTNPGGHLVASAPGPDPTDGSVSLPTLGVSAPIVRVGLDNNDNMVLPENARDIAWLDQGPFPGATNNVVLAGHINWGGVPGAFDNIERLRPGDVVTIVLHGKTWRYAVSYSCLFPYNSLRGRQVIGYTNVPSLTMISCAGTWDAAAGTHNERIVVRAEQVYPPIPKPAAKRATAGPTPTPSSGIDLTGFLQHS